jgi:hypothetical protein
VAEHDKQQQAAPTAAADIRAQVRAELQEEYRQKEVRLRAELGERAPADRTEAERAKRIEALQAKAGQATKKRPMAEKERLELALLTEGGSILSNGVVYATLEEWEAAGGAEEEGGAK